MQSLDVSIRMQPREPLAYHRFDPLRRKIAALGAMLEHLAIADARSDYIRREVEQVHILTIEQHDAIVRVVHAEALRGGFERYPAYCEQRVGGPLFANACRFAAARRH